MKSLVAVKKMTPVGPTSQAEGWQPPEFSFPAPAEASRKLAVDAHYRSVLKAISWRATGTIDTMVITFLITGRLELALSIGFVELFTKVALFYVHERVWNKISFGRVPPKGDYEI